LVVRAAQAKRPPALSDVELRPPVGVKATPLRGFGFEPPQNLKPGPKGGGGGGGAPPPASPAGSSGGGSAPPGGAAPQSAFTTSTPAWQVKPIATPIIPDAYGEAKSGAASGAIDLAFATFNRRNKALQREHELAERARLQAEIDATRNAHPEWGALLIVHQRQIEDPTGFSQGKLSPFFAGITVGYGRDPREAERQIGPAAFSGVGELQSSSTIWLPPLRPEDPPPPSPPWPVAALATFSSSSPTLTDVAWGLLPFGFDDAGTLALEVPPGVVPRFYVLEVPATAEAVVMRPSEPGHKQGAIAQETRGGLPVARLDVYVPFDHDVAAAIYPADGATAALFQTVPATRYWRLIEGVPNLDLVRWAAPEQISVVPDRTVFELLER
jgi:hypothetical protein